MCTCIYMAPRVLTGTDVYNCHHNENTEEFHHQNTRWPQTVLTLAMFADSTVLPFPEWHINGSLQHMAFLNWLSFSIGAAARMVVVSQRAVFQVRVATVGPGIDLMDDVRIVFLKTIFLIFLKSPHAATKTQCSQIKQTTPSFDSNLKKKSWGILLAQHTSKILAREHQDLAPSSNGKNRRNTYWISIHYPAAGL